MFSIEIFFLTKISFLEHGEHFVAGGLMFKKKNAIEYCTKSYFSHVILFYFLFSSLHYRKLFYANEIFQGILIHVKAMCEVYYYGQTNRVKPLCLFDRYAYQETLTLQEFSRRQFTQMNITVAKLLDFTDQIAVLAADACQVNHRKTNFIKNKMFFFFILESN